MDTSMTGILIRGVGGLYGVRPFPLSVSDEVLLCRARGIFRHDGISPLPGDIVRISPTDDRATVKGAEREAAYVIDEILPRKNTLTRPPLANLTHLFLVIPSAKPAPDLITADKLICIAEAAEIEPIIIVTKRDLSPEKAKEIRQLYEGAGFRTFTTAADETESIDTLRSFLFSLAADGKTVTAAFAGASGAGKSTLMTRIFPTLSLKTGAVSRKIERGKQTTRHVELFPFDDGANVCFIADTPGFSMLDFARHNYIDPMYLADTFREFRPYLGTCRYTKCAHIKEEGCAILEAMRSGTIAACRCASYSSILEECRKKPDWKRRLEEKSNTHG